MKFFEFFMAIARATLCGSTIFKDSLDGLEKYYMKREVMPQQETTEKRRLTNDRRTAQAKEPARP